MHHTVYNCEANLIVGYQNYHTMPTPNTNQFAPQTKHSFTDCDYRLMVGLTVGALLSEGTTTGAEVATGAGAGVGDGAAAGVSVNTNTGRFEGRL